MSFLKKFGQIAGEVGKVALSVAGVAPYVQAALPGQSEKIQIVSADLAQIATIAQEVEVIGQALSLPGTQKLQAATPLVAQVILQSSLLANHKISNPALFAQGSQKIADGMADVLNSLKDEVATENKTA